MKWSRRTALIAGLALVAVTNVVALGGAAYNRSGEPESTLRLTQRELQPPFAWTAKKEDSGLALQLRWRVVSVGAPSTGIYGFYTGDGGSPAWLDAPKMASLGFDTQVSADSRGASRTSPYERQLPRNVLVVLELDGSAYQEALQRAGQAAKEVESKNERGDGKKSAQAIMDREEHFSSRLFAVDVGLDRGALRSKFPDRTKYAIVRGQVRPASDQSNHARAGNIQSLSAATVNVPLDMRGAFEGIMPSNYGQPDAQDQRFEATLAFGKRLEPWLVTAVKW